MSIYPDYSCYEKLPKEKRSFFKSETKHFPAPIDVITLQGKGKLHCRAQANYAVGQGYMMVQECCGMGEMLYPIPNVREKMRTQM